MKIVFDSLKTDVSIGDKVEIKIKEQVKQYVVDKIETNEVQDSLGTSGYTSLSIKPV
jgi:hypothetical protein